MTKLIAITPEAEKIISYCARVSNPANQENHDTAPKLLKYCIKHGHWSVFEMANLVIEITTGRDIAPQILRHRSFSFQEFSQRYAQATTYVARGARSQDLKNKQASHDNMDEDTKIWFKNAQEDIWNNTNWYYEAALKKGIAKECARALLPLNTETTLYMNGTVRSWVHYCVLRCDKSTQLEHREVANGAWKIIREQLPNVALAVEELHPHMKEIQ